MNKTERLFDISSKTSCFKAVVLSCQPHNDNSFEVVLDRTAFFPEEGGQSSDTGKLGDATVTQVFEKEGIIYHVTDRPLTEDNCVDGEIDFSARFRKMQNHTGEHIVSGLVHKNYGFNNVGFHLGEYDMTADFDGELDAEQIKYIETLANKAVFECHPVRGYYPDTESLSKIEYRSKLDITDGVRIVEIEGVDLCACCAPHVENTGEVGLIKITEFVRYKGGVRVHIRCGYDALDAFRDDYEQVKQISVAISAKHGEVYEGIERLLEDIGGLRGEISALKRELLGHRLEKIEYTDGNICIFETDSDMLALRNLVNSAKEKCGGVCAVFSGDDDKGYKYIISSKTVDLRALSNEINAAISGRGGGSCKMIQGSCTAKRAVIEKYFQEKTLF